MATVMAPAALTMANGLGREKVESRPKEEKTLRMVVKIQGGSHEDMEVTVSDNMRVGELKTFIYDETGVEEKHQTLYFKDNAACPAKSLSGARYLRSYDLPEEGGVLLVEPSLLGGSGGKCTLLCCTCNCCKRFECLCKLNCCDCCIMKCKG